MVKLVLLGIAHPHAEFWANAWKAHPRAELVGVWDENKQAAADFASRHGVLCFSTREEALAQEDVTAVGVCAENARHADYVIAAAEHKKDILCEKPTATTLEDCQRMMRAIEQADVRYMQAFPMRVDPVNTRIKELLDSGELGRVLSFRKRHGNGWAAEGTIPASFRWFTDPAMAGYGAFMDEGIHAADFLIWMFGRPLAVTARIPASSSGLAVDDNGIAIVEFENGVIGTMQSSWTFTAGGVTTEIYAQKGAILQEYNDGASTTVNGENNFPLRIYRAGQPLAGWESPRMPTNFKVIHERVASRYIDCLESGDPFPSTIQDGYAALRLILAAYLSAKQSRRICLED